MKKRQAKKIVSKQKTGATTFRWASVVRAFRRLGKRAPAREVVGKVEQAVEDVKEAVEEVAEAAEAVEEVVDLAKLKVAELKAMAKSKGIPGYSGMKKADLIKALS